jgi:hypothetical protein
MKKVLIVLLAIAYFGAGTPASAQVAASASATPSSDITSKLKERIEKVVEEKRDQIKGVIDRFGDNNRGIIGQVVRVNQESITVKNPKGTLILPLDPQVSLIKKGKDIKVADIAVDDWVVVVGESQDKDTFVPKRITVITTNPRPYPYQVYLGTISTLDKNNIIITTRGKNESVTIVQGKTTTYEDLSGKKIDKKLLEADLQVLIVSYFENGQWQARAIKVLTALD